MIYSTSIDKITTNKVTSKLESTRLWLHIRIKCNMKEKSWTIRFMPGTCKSSIMILHKYVPVKFTKDVKLKSWKLIRQILILCL